MTSDELFHLSHLYSELKDVKKDVENTNPVNDSNQEQNSHTNYEETQNNGYEGQETFSHDATPDDSEVKEEEIIDPEIENKPIEEDEKNKKIQPII